MVAAVTMSDFSLTTYDRTRLEKPRETMDFGFALLHWGLRLLSVDERTPRQFS